MCTKGCISSDTGNVILIRFCLLALISITLRTFQGPKKEFGDCLSEIAHFGARNSGVQFLIENAMQLFPDYVVTPRSLYASPGGIYARSMNMAPKRYN